MGEATETMEKGAWILSDDGMKRELRALSGLSALLREARIPDGDEWEDVSILCQDTIERLVDRVRGVEKALAKGDVEVD